MAPSRFFKAIRFGIFSLLLGAAALISSTNKPGFTEKDKAFYLDPAKVDFVRPGFVIKISGVSIDPDGTIKARFKLTDPKGLPLDREGITTPGAISVSFIAARIPQSQAQYTAYTTRVVTSPVTNVTTTQASSDSGGAFRKIGDGEYEYTFKTKAANFDPTVTHTVGAYGSRDLSEFNLGRNFDDDVFTFVPNGSKVVTVRDIVRTTSCNRCHDPLALHGGARRSTELCILCHTPQTTDPDTGNTVNFPVMIHKIHMGKSLPSVKNGTPYKIIGNAQSVHDWSTVVFPADARNCTVCHDQNSGAVQATAYLTNPSRTACGACHDNVNFATGEHHSLAELPQVTDNLCKTCHTPEGELEFDASIIGAHIIPRFSRDLPKTTFEIKDVVDGYAGKRPIVVFTIRDKNGNPILPSEMTGLSLVMAGPTSDYAGVIRENARNADCGGAENNCWHMFEASIASGAKGTFSVGIEGYRNVKLLAGTRKERTVRDAGENKVFHFSVDGAPEIPRRQVVDIAKCNSCHSSLSMHGDNRNRTEQCVLCHNPNQTDIARRPADKMPPQTVAFKTMIHRIHTGEDSKVPYTIYGFGGTPNDFTEVRFPGDRRNCAKCHVNGSENLPLPDNLLAVQNPAGILNPMGPVTAACLGCHTSTPAASHALGNTTVLGEACTVCHGGTAEFSVQRVHAR